MDSNPIILWFWGKAGAGKTYTALNLKRQMVGTKVLDADVIRLRGKNIDFTPEGRMKHNKCLAEEAFWFHSRGFNVLVTSCAPTREIRRMIRAMLPNVIMLYVQGGVWDENFKGQGSPWEGPE